MSSPRPEIGNGGLNFKIVSPPPWVIPKTTTKAPTPGTPDGLTSNLSTDLIIKWLKSSLILAPELAGDRRWTVNHNLLKKAGAGFTLPSVFYFSGDTNLTSPPPPSPTPVEGDEETTDFIVFTQKLWNEHRLNPTEQRFYDVAIWRGVPSLSSGNRKDRTRDDWLAMWHGVMPYGGDPDQVDWWWLAPSGGVELQDEI